MAAWARRPGKGEEKRRKERQTSLVITEVDGILLIPKAWQADSG